MFDFLFNPSGRISRRGFAIGFFPPYVLVVGLPGFLLPAEQPVVGALISVAGLFFFWPSLVAVPVKRFHDLGHSGWWHAAVIAIGLVAQLYALRPFVLEVIADPSAAEALNTNDMTGLQAMMAFDDMLRDSPYRYAACPVGSLIGYAEMAFFLIAPGSAKPTVSARIPWLRGEGSLSRRT